MMQNVASAKSNVAAFAALNVAGDSADTATSFEQVLQQQSTSDNELGSMTAKTSVPAGQTRSAEQPARAESNKGRATQPPAEAQHKTQNSTSASAPDTKLVDNGAALDAQAQNHSEENTPNKLSQADEGEQGESELIKTEAQDSEDWLSLVLQLNLHDDNLASETNSNTTHLLDGADEPEMHLSEQARTLLGQLQLISDSALTSEEKLAAASTLLTNATQSSVTELSQAMSSKVEADSLIAKALASLSAVLPATQDSELKQAQPTTVLSQESIDKHIKALLSLLQNQAEQSRDLSELQQQLASLSKGDIKPDAADYSALARMLASIAQGQGAEKSAAAQAQQSATSAVTPPLQAEIAALLTALNSVEGQSVSRDPLAQMQIVASTPVLAAASAEPDTKAATSKAGAVNASLNVNVVPTPVNAEVSSLQQLSQLSGAELDELLATAGQKVAAIVAEYISASPAASRVAKSVTGEANGLVAEVMDKLKAGLSEFKQQLADGHQPGLDLKALVEAAMSKQAEPQLSAKISENLQNTISALSDALRATRSLDSPQSSAAAVASLHSLSESLTSSTEAVKTPVAGQLDKAINIYKPDAHQQLAEKVRWMVNTNNLIAEIRLDPAELGSMQVKVSMSADSATVNFVVQSHQTRDALESATHKLRELLADKGIELGQSTVRQESQNKQDGQGQQGSSAGQNQSELGDNMAQQTHAQAANEPVNTSVTGGVDYFV